MAEEWVGRVRSAEDGLVARRLYQGRSFREAEQAAEAGRAQFAILSAGLGLVPADAPIPAYSLTVASDAADNVIARLEPAANAVQWWRELRRTGLGSDIAAMAGDGLILLAAGRVYLEMLAADLERLSRDDLQRVRVFTAAPARELPGIFAGIVMPYDDRLDGPDSGRAGTLSDFAQRAVHDFTINIAPRSPSGSVLEHSSAILERMKDWRRPQRSRGASFSDAEIRKVIVQHWQTVGGRSSAMLRFLRSDLGIACEQGRFRRLFNDLNAERAA